MVVLANAKLSILNNNKNSLKGDTAMHEKIELIRQALNAAQDAEIKLSSVAIEALQEVNQYIFEVEVLLQQAEEQLIDKGVIAHG